MKRQLLLTFLLISMVGMLYAPVAYMQTSKKAPNFSFADVKGNNQSLTANKGKVILVDQWATWCGPCKKEIPTFIQLQKKHGDKLAVIGISYDDEKTVVTDYLKKDNLGQQINYAIIFGADLKNSPFGTPEALPALTIIDKKGNVRKEHVGFISGEELTGIVEKLLAE